MFQCPNNSHFNYGRNKKRRPHVLKIDVEGADYAVLTGFIKDSTLVSDLPLMILFEVGVNNTASLIIIILYLMLSSCIEHLTLPSFMILFETTPLSLVLTVQHNYCASVTLSSRLSLTNNTLFIHSLLDRPPGQDAWRSVPHSEERARGHRLCSGRQGTGRLRSTEGGDDICPRTRGNQRPSEGRHTSADQE